MNPRKRYPSGKPMSRFAEKIATFDDRRKTARKAARPPRNKVLSKIGERSVLTKGAAKTAAKTVAKRLGALGAVYTAADIGAGIYDRQVAINRESAAKRLRDEATALDKQMEKLRKDKSDDKVFNLPDMGVKLVRVNKAPKTPGSRQAGRGRTYTRPIIG
jgi:hypothetical protein